MVPSLVAPSMLSEQGQLSSLFLEMNRWVGKLHLEGSNYMEIYFGGGLHYILGVQVWTQLEGEASLKEVMLIQRPEVLKMLEVVC